MAKAPKVFISYSSVDKELAQKLYGDLQEKGADVFEFIQSAAAGEPAWVQVLSWISKSDAFVVLVSKTSLASSAVEAEISHAHHSHINRKRPKKLIPAIIEPDVKPPIELERFTTIDLRDYRKGLSRLVRELGISKPGGVKVELPPLPTHKLYAMDFDTIFADHKKVNPQPTKEEDWSAGVNKILAGYKTLKPKGIGKKKEKEHIDSILQDFIDVSLGKETKPKYLHELDNALLGFKFASQSEKAEEKGKSISEICSITTLPSRISRLMRRS